MSEILKKPKSDRRISNKEPPDFSTLLLKRFCPKPHLEIELLVPQTLRDYEFLAQLVEAGNDFEELSNTCFVTYEDATDLAQSLIQKEPVKLPKWLKKSVEPLFNVFEQELTSYRESKSISVDTLAAMAKLAIINSLYKAYVAEVKNMQRKEQLQKQLTKLVKDQKCKVKGKDKKDAKKDDIEEGELKDQKHKKRNKSPEKKNKERKKSPGEKTKERKKSPEEKTKERKKSPEEKTKERKKSPDEKTEGRKKSPVKKSKSDTWKSQTTFSAKPDKQIKEMDDYTEIALKESDLVFDYDLDTHVFYVVLCGFCPLIIREMVKLNVNVSNVVEISSALSNPDERDDFDIELHEMFDDMKNEYLENTVLMKYQCSEDTDITTALEELFYVIRKINLTKRQHFRYIKDIKLYDFGETPEKLEVNTMEKYNRILSVFPPELVNIPIIVGALVQEVCWRLTGCIHTLSDLSIDTSVSSRSSHLKPENSKGYQVHEKDLLFMTLNSYKLVGRKHYDSSLDYLELLKPLEHFVDESLVVRTRTRAVSTEEDCFCDHAAKLYSYLHLAIFSQMQRKDLTPQEVEEYDFITTLITQDDRKAYQDLLPTGIEDGSSWEGEDVIANYHMKENVSSSVLRQLVFDALDQFSCWERFYCDQTKAVLLRLHDNLNECGIGTLFWNQSLLTPVCLRDFCKYITVENRDWMEKHLLDEHSRLAEDEECDEEGEIGEKCKGIQEIKVPELYQEYQHLLEMTSAVAKQEKRRVFDEAKAELLNYPRSDELTSYCNSETASLLGYDLGVKRLQVTGHTTVFHSDDGVKVTIDASRFLLEEPKCSININTGGHNCVFHSSDSSCRVILKDGTIFNFTEIVTEADEVTPIVIDEEDVEEEIRTHQMEEEETKQLVEEQKTYMNWVQLLRKCKIPTILNTEDLISKAVQLDDDNMDDLLKLFKEVLLAQRTIYKISAKASLQRLKRTVSPVQLPLTNLLRRMFFKHPPKKRKIRGFSVHLSTQKVKKKTSVTYDFAVTLPNGLYITTLPRKRPLVELKQTYKFSKGKERHRIFYANGVILVKNVDGTTTIYRSNGDIIHLTQYHQECCTDCSKNLRHMFHDEGCLHNPSRIEETPRPTREDDYYALWEFGNIPYTQKTVLDFEGKKTTIVSGRVKEEHTYYGLYESDYCADETMFDREDGFRCITYHDGRQLLQFPDGTTISARVVMEKELISVGKPSKHEGWVSVLINYEYKHPDYLSLSYNGVEGYTQMILAEAAIKHDRNCFTMVMHQDVVVDITGENFTILKTCSKCDGDCICRVYMGDRPDAKFLEVYDSYGKYLTCDQDGRVEIDPNFVKGALNKFDCNHRWQNERQKLFVLNQRGAAGTLVWRDSAIEDIFKYGASKKNVTIVNYMNQLTERQTVEFYEQIFKNFRRRFASTKPYRIKLSKDRCDEEEQPSYATFRVLEDIRSVADDATTCEQLIELLETVGGSATAMILSGMQKMFNFRRAAEVEVVLTYRDSLQTKPVAQSQPSLPKDDQAPKRTVEEIVAAWRAECEKYRELIRNREFKPYFHSEYYQEVLQSLNAVDVGQNV